MCFGTGRPDRLVDAAPNVNETMGEGIGRCRMRAGHARFRINGKRSCIRVALVESILPNT